MPPPAALAYDSPWAHHCEQRIGEAVIRVSEFYKLSGTQSSFDFIDVDVSRDVALFIDPASIAALGSPWAAACISNVQDFFQRVLDRVTAKDEPGALKLLSGLGEDNSTHLGYSDSSRGSGLGPGLAQKFYDELRTSRAVLSGLITDLEDTALLIEGVREDRISDVTTNIIREQLVEFTQETARFYGIKMEKNVVVGPFWRKSAGWVQEPVELPMPNGRPLLLVPKYIVRRTLFYNPSEYYRHYVLEFFKADELERKSALTYTIKSGEVRIRKKDVESKYRTKHGASRDRPGVEKRINVDGTEQNPDMFTTYKSDKDRTPPSPLENEDIAERARAQLSDLDELLDAVLVLSPGNDDAVAYEKAVEALLTALFHPSLASPTRQYNIHEGRKRIDINYTNVGIDGFFHWLGLHHPAANIVVECKNYTRPVANPEFDQLSGRFSPSRGKYGLLVYRSFEDKAKMLASLRDTALDQRGFITALDDADLATLVAEAKAGSCTALGGLLDSRFRALV